MIFSGFNSLVQLFAAVYLTMSFDSQFLRQFWAQDYKKKINDEFNSIDMPEPAKEVSKNYAISTAQYEERRMRKRGTFMFVLMVFLLIVIGFEQGIVSYTGYRGLLFCYLFFSIVMGLLNCFDEDIMKRWLWEYIILFALILLFCTAIITLPFFNCYESVKNEFSFGFKVAVKVLLILTIIAPATVQLFRNWLYGKYYLPQVKSDILEIVNEYDDSTDQDKDKVLEKRLAEVFFPDLGPLVSKSWKEYRYNSPSRCKLRRLYKRLCSITSTQERIAYCEEKNVNFDIFAEFSEMIEYKEAEKRQKRAKRDKKRRSRVS